MGANTDGRFQTRQFVDLGNPNANNPATTELVRVKFFTQVLVRELRGTVLTPGTTTTAGYTILKGTASIGALTCSTIAAGSSVDASLADTTFAATDFLVLKNITSDTNLDLRLMLDYSELFSAT